MYKLAFFTPLKPQRSGISDWMEEMLPYIRLALGKEYVIDFFLDGFVPESNDIIENHNFYDISEFEDKINEYDLYVYQIGNNGFHEKIYDMAMRYSGIIALHDFAIHHMVAGKYLCNLKDDNAYFKEVENNHGSKAKELAYKRAVAGELGLWETDAVLYPMNRTIVQHSEGVIVFSDFAKNRIQQYAECVPIHKVNLHCGGVPHLCDLNEVNAVREKLGIKMDDGEKLISVIGFIGRIKRPYTIIDAIEKLYHQGNKIRLVFVGQLQDDCKDLRDKIKQKGLDKAVSISGYINNEMFDDYLRASDICISLRYPTMGETSSALTHILRYGKPTIVTDIGTFSEIPDDVVVKIGYGETEKYELIKSIQHLLQDIDYYAMLQNGALHYAESYLKVEDTAESFATFLKTAICFRKLQKDSRYKDIKKRLITDGILHATNECEVPSEDMIYIYNIIKSF